jgi:cellulose synthase/poly-beta-1,6-N-acetylglucosamine synthase-like glycosyltransferase
MNTKAQVFILCEDTVHYHFARKYFELQGFNSKKITGKYNPKGISVGSGAEYVKENYAREIKAFHSKVNHLDYILVVIIDDDTKEHIKSLYQIYTPLENEKVLIFSPKRNIESWFYYIDGNNVSESEDYKKNYRNTKPTEFAKKLKEEICAIGLPENAPSSLHHACKELNRIKL